jgi:2-keto-4-pentenoate hydratase/2-oxohepta-3-ene-1,7-dioic acid hydratase in catechol pathway
VHLVTFEPRSAPTGEGPAVASAFSAQPLDLETRRPGGRRLGAILRSGGRAGSIVDLNQALTVQLAVQDSGAPEAEAESLVPHDMIGFLRRGENALRQAMRALVFVEECLDRYDAPDLAVEGALFDRRGVHLLAPIPRPGKIIGVARNYPDHARELGSAEFPQEPVLFLKAPSAVIGPEEPIVLPRASQQVDYEGELAVVIGRAARDVHPDDALSHVVGYMPANDVTARDFQHVRGQAFLGKSCDGFAPFGPALVTADEVPDPQDLGLRTSLSGTIVQSARTKEMIFPVQELVAFASRFMTLEPGDVLLTGTPAGVGKAQKPPRWLRDGDVVEVEIERLGRLVCHVVREGRTRP